MKSYTRLRIIKVNQKSAANLENPITLQCGPQQPLLPNNQTNNQTSKQTNNQTNKQTNNQTDQQTNDQIDKRTESPSTRSSVKQVCNVWDKKEETTKWKDKTNKGQQKMKWNVNEKTKTKSENLVWQVLKDGGKEVISELIMSLKVPPSTQPKI